jgi:hypothetical protein
MRTTVGAFADASRPIVRDLQSLLDVITLAPPFDDLRSKSGIELYFPVLNQFDARVVETRDRRAVFISSRLLDAIELFAHSIGAWSWLNSHLNERSLVPTGLPPVPYAWLPFLIKEQYVELGEVPTGYADYHNRLTRHFLRGMVTLVDMGQIAIRLTGRDEVDYNGDDLIEPRYLAAVTLLYVYLHESAHLLSGHNELVPPPLTDFERLVEASIREVIEKDNEAAGEIVARPLWGAGSGRGFTFEMDADFLAVRSTMPQYGDVVLEATSLWLTALGTCRRGGADVFDAFRQSTGEEHPPYPMRVWFLNGALSSFTRQGQIARSVRRAVERMAGAAVPYKPKIHHKRMSAGPGGSKWVRRLLGGSIKPV